MEPYQQYSVYVPGTVDYEECANSIIPINDDNYRVVVDWFKACLLLSNNLPLANRDDYELKVIGNVKSSLSNFFQRTELSLSTLIGLEGEISAMFRGLGPPVAAKSLADCEPACTQSDAPEDIGEAMNQMYRRLLWVAIASVILLVLLVLVLATLAWLKSYIERDIKDMFVACPNADQIASGEGEGEEGEEGEEEEYAYPVRVWMAPLKRKRQPTKTIKCLKKSGAKDKILNKNLKH